MNNQNLAAREQLHQMNQVVNHQMIRDGQVVALHRDSPNNSMATHEW